MIQDHFRTLGIAHIAYAVIMLVPAILVFTVLSGIGILSDDPHATAILTTIGFFIAVFLCVLAVPGIIAGLALLGQKTWGLALALVIGVLNLFCFPFGTALGAYTIWVFVKQQNENKASEERSTAPAE